MTKVGKIRLYVGAAALLLVEGVLLAIYTEVIRVGLVGSNSMEPTLRKGDRIIVDKDSPHKPFDIIAFRDPSDPKGRPLVKRIVGVAGDAVKIASGVLTVNGVERRRMNSAANTDDWPDTSLTIPRGTVFVLGDNHDDNFDSLDFGPVPENLIIGKMWLTIWPIGRIGFVKQYEPAP